MDIESTHETPQVSLDTDNQTSVDEAKVVAAINYLINSCINAQKAGIYTLQEAATIVESSRILQEKFGKPFST